MSERNYNPDFTALIEAIARRPALYVGTLSLRAIGNYLDGYCHALGDLGLSGNQFFGFKIWLSKKYLIFHAAWHWTRILRHVYQNDETAIQALPDLFAEYLQESKEKNLEQLENDRDEALIAAYGRAWHEPEKTQTST